jgi:hypothetical protein
MIAARRLFARLRAYSAPFAFTSFSFASVLRAFGAWSFFAYAFSLTALAFQSETTQKNEMQKKETQKEEARNEEPSALPDPRMDVRWGGFLGGNYNRSRVNFYELPGLYDNLTPFVEGEGFGGYGGFLVEFPLAPWLHLGVRGSVVQQATRLVAEPEQTAVGAANGVSDVGVFMRLLDANLVSAGFQFLLGISPFQNFHLFLGARADFFVLKTYEQLEFLVEPSYGRFEDGLVEYAYRARNRQAGTMPGVRALGVANLSLALMGGVGYELPLNAAESLTLAPEIWVSRGLTNVIQANDVVTGEPIHWQLDNLHAALALRWYPARAARFDAEKYQLNKIQVLEKQIAEERRKIQAELKELRSSGLSAKITEIIGIGANDGAETPNPTLRVEEFRTIKRLQLAPYVFFNENSSVLPQRYRRIAASARATYRIESLEKSPPVEAYLSLLNVVGKRMSQNAAATLFITGYTSGKGAESRNERLAEQRAQAVADYLQDVWKIPAARLVAQKRGAPPDQAAKAGSGVSEEEADAENRRVELSSSAPDILAPLEFDSIELTVNPPALEFGLSVFAGAGIKQWTLEVSQFEGREENTLHTFTGGAPAPERYRWEIDRDQSSIPRVSGALDVRLSLTDVDNRDADAPIVSIPVSVVKYADKKRAQRADEHVFIYTLNVVGADKEQEAALLKSARERLQKRARAFVSSEAALETTLQGYVRALQASGGQASVRSSSLRRHSATTTAADTPEERIYKRAVTIEVRETVQ